MAETTRPTRTRKATGTAAKAAPAKAAPAKAAAATEEAPPRPDAVVELTHVGDTKNWSKWAIPEGEPGTGNVYAPLGTEAVRIALYGVPETK